MKKAIVVAHPDDEILWAGGLPIRYPGDWTIICCSTPVKIPQRAEQFMGVCTALGTRGKIYQENDVSGKILLKCLDQIDLEEFDHIVTHNKWGEYGHPHHKQVHRYIASKYNHKPLTTFGYRKGGLGMQRIELTSEELERKMVAFKQYGSLVKYKEKRADGRSYKGWINSMAGMVKDRISPPPTVYKERPLWEELSEIYYKNKKIDPALETFDGVLLA